MATSRRTPRRDPLDAIIVSGDFQFAVNKKIISASSPLLREQFAGALPVNKTPSYSPHTPLTLLQHGEKEIAVIHVDMDAATLHRILKIVLGECIGNNDGAIALTRLSEPLKQHVYSLTTKRIDPSSTLPVAAHVPPSLPVTDFGRATDVLHFQKQSMDNICTGLQLFSVNATSRTTGKKLTTCWNLIRVHQGAKSLRITDLPRLSAELLAKLLPNTSKEQGFVRLLDFTYKLIGISFSDNQVGKIMLAECKIGIQHLLKDKTFCTLLSENGPLATIILSDLVNGSRNTEQITTMRTPEFHMPIKSRKTRPLSPERRGRKRARVGNSLNDHAQACRDPDSHSANCHEPIILWREHEDTLRRVHRAQQMDISQLQDQLAQCTQREVRMNLCIGNLTAGLTRSLQSKDKVKFTSPESHEKLLSGENHGRKTPPVNVDTSSGLSTFVERQEMNSVSTDQFLRRIITELNEVVSANNNQPQAAASQNLSIVPDIDIGLTKIDARFNSTRDQVYHGNNELPDLHDYKSEVLHLKTQVRKLNQEVERKTDALEKTCAEREKFRTQLRGSSHEGQPREERDRLLNQLEQLRGERDQLRVQLEQSREESDQLRKQLEQTRSELQESKGRLLAPTAALPAPTPAAAAAAAALNPPAMQPSNQLRTFGKRIPNALNPHLSKC